MLHKTNREFLTMAFDVLVAMQAAGKKGIIKYHIAKKAGVNVNSGYRWPENLLRAELVTEFKNRRGRTFFLVTDRGRDFIRKYEELRS